MRRSTRVAAALAAGTAAMALANLAPSQAATAPSTATVAHPRPGALHAVPGSVTPAGTVTAQKTPTSALARTPQSLRGIHSAKLIPVMIKLDYDPLATYSGDVKGYAATSPATTRHPLRSSWSAKKSYLKYEAKYRSGVASRITTKVKAARITRAYDVVYGGVAARVPGNQIAAILKIPGVVAVQRDALRQPLDDASNTFINATATYPAVGGAPNAGKGVIFGDLDTGLWPEHPMFKDTANLAAPPATLDGAARPCDFGDNPTTAVSDPFVCTHKLIGGRAFLSTYLSDPARAAAETFTNARDSDGHGTHTSSTAAGSVVKNPTYQGRVLAAKTQGIAPGAWVEEFKVCGKSGCFSSDSAAAVQRAILDGVKVINFSISGGSDPLSDPVELAFLDAYAAGVSVAASAGNSGPGAGTAEHAGPWVTTVGASTQSREFDTTIHLTAANGDTYSVDGASITSGVASSPVVQAGAAPYSDALCSAPAPAGTFTGKIVVCQRGGGIARIAKGYNVFLGGAAGMILYNAGLADVETDNHWLPAAHVPDGTALVAFLNAHSAVTGSWAPGAARNGSGGDVMASFSSRGPLGAFVKPDIAAPGVQILAGNTPVPDDVTLGPPGEYYQAIAGTSMAAPHIAGSAILMASLHPTWTPGQIHSAMITTAATKVVKEDGVTAADPFDDGGGRINVGAAAKAPLTLDETATDYASLTGDPAARIDLNTPSIDAPAMPGTITTTRTLKNVTADSLTVSPSASTTGTDQITFSPSRLTLAPGASGSFAITISSSGPAGQHFGKIRFATADGIIHLPVAFVPKQGSVSLAQTCPADTLATGATMTCTVTAQNKGAASSDVALKTTGNADLFLTKATGATFTGGTVTASGTLGGVKAGVPSLVQPADPVAGYLPLDSFGAAPQPIGDEQIINLNVPEFVYDGKPVSRIGVDSNGYLVMGGGTAADNECCNIPPGASSNSPNNILAPFWTDLDGTGEDGILATTLTDGTNSWLVVEWRENTFGTQNLQTFETWIGIDGTQDITFDYDPSDLPSDPAQPFLVAAENEFGEGQGIATLPTADYRVESTDPTPGGSLTYTVVVKGQKAGAGLLNTSMTATGTRGTTVVHTAVTVGGP